MEGGLRLQTRRPLLQHMIPQYRKASTVKKRREGGGEAAGWTIKGGAWFKETLDCGAHGPCS